jgi:plastocyanin
MRTVHCLGAALGAAAFTLLCLPPSADARRQGAKTSQPPRVTPNASPAASAERQGAILRQRAIMSYSQRMMMTPYGMMTPYSMMTPRGSGYGASGSYGSSGSSGSYGQGQQQAPAAPVAQVSVEDGYFVPTSFGVPPGAAVRWVNYGRHNHTVTADDGGWDSGELGPGAAASYTFGRPGVYSFYCRMHPIMRFTVVVRPAY